MNSSSLLMGFSTTLRQKLQAEQWFGGIDVARALETFGSPLFFLSEHTLKEQYRRFTSALSKHYPHSAVAYSFKTNYLPRICHILGGEGAWAEVVSGFEYELARKLGYQGSEIVFNGPLKIDRDLERALIDGARINIDNREELERVVEIARKIGVRGTIGIRLNSSQDSFLAMARSGWNRFGFTIENGEASAACARLTHAQNHLRIAGFQMHIGTNISSPQLYERAAEILSSFACRMKEEFNLNLEYLDLGGGIGAEHLRPRNRELWDVRPIEEFICSIARVLKKNISPLPKLILEPGRSLVSGCMALVTKVVSVKETIVGVRHVAVDGSVSILPTALTHVHRISPLNAGWHLSTFNTIIFGSSCMSHDVLGSALLPPLKADDILAIEDCGAYSLSRSSQFIFPRPAVVTINSDESLALIRRGEEVSDLLDLDQFPSNSPL